MDVEALDAATCVVCLEVFRTPVSLPCGHTFCDGPCSASDSCALCREPRGLGQLPRNYTAEGMIAQVAARERRVVWSHLDRGRLLAETAGAEVHRATYDGQEVVMKRLRSEVVGGARRAVEVVMLQRLPVHPNVVPFVGSCEDAEGRPVIVTLYQSGGSLKDALAAENGRPDVGTATSRAFSIARGLQHLHAHSVLHRDLKSANVLLDTEGVCRLVDFGSAATLRDATLTGAVGTPAWISPECLQNQRYGAASDVYSLGVVLWELFSGKLPFAEMLGPMQVMLHVAQGGRLTIDPAWPRFLRDMLPAVWALEPAHRPALEEVIVVLEENLRIDLRVDTTGGLVLFSDGKFHYRMPGRSTSVEFPPNVTVREFHNSVVREMEATTGWDARQEVRLRCFSKEWQDGDPDVTLSEFGHDGGGKFHVDFRTGFFAPDERRAEVKIELCLKLPYWLRRYETVTVRAHGNMTCAELCRLALASAPIPLDAEEGSFLDTFTCNWDPEASSDKVVHVTPPERLHEIFDRKLPSELGLTLLTWTSDAYAMSAPQQGGDLLDVVVVFHGARYQLQTRASETFRQLREQLVNRFAALDSYIIPTEARRPGMMERGGAPVVSPSQRAEALRLVATKCAFSVEGVWVQDGETLGSRGVENLSQLGLGDGMFQVLIQTLAVGSFALEVHSLDKVVDIKSAIQDREGIFPHQLRLIYGSKMLQDGLTLGECGVQDSASIQLLLRLLGT